MSLAFEVIAPPDRAWISEAAALWQAGTPFLRVVPLTPTPWPGGLITHERLGTLADAGWRAACAQALSDRRHGALRVRQGDAGDVLLVATHPPELHVAVFGAGHVGRALVQALAPLPLALTWIDPRAQALAPSLCARAELRCSDDPLAELADLPADAAILVLTHSHALDFELVQAALRRREARFIGLIGSLTKRRSFEARLRDRGFDDRTLARLSCPIGLDRLPGKEPAVIAASVAAQMMRVARRPAALRTDRQEQRHVG